MTREDGRREDLELEIVPLEAARSSDFLRLHDERNGLGWCRCVAWWVETIDGWGDRSTAKNLALRAEVLARGECDGLLACAGGEPVGWCQCGPRDRLPGIRSAFARPPDPGVWAVTCFAIAPSHRGRGVARALLAAALERAEAHGATAVEAFPRRDEPGGSSAPRDRREAGEEWTGPLALFRASGFEVADDSRPRRVVMQRRTSRPRGPRGAR